MKRLRRRPRRNPSPGGGARGQRPRPLSPDRDGTTEQRILDAAHLIFLRAGTAGARMQDIAAEAGVNQALLHYYFRSKAHLSEAVFRRAARQLFPVVIEIIASDLALEEKVTRVVQVELEQLSRTPYLPGYILSELAHHAERAPQLVSTLVGVGPEALVATLFSTLGRQIDEEVRSKRMRPIAPEQFLVNLLSLCIFPFAARPMLLALLRLDQRGFEQFIETRREDLAAFFLRALRP
jgi:TetR/AcrR family transcriptional regulator